MRKSRRKSSRRSLRGLGASAAEHAATARSMQSRFESEFKQAKAERSCSERIRSLSQALITASAVHANGGRDRTGDVVSALDAASKKCILPGALAGVHVGMKHRR